MNDADAQQICRQCGLCCSGALFADVELRDSREATAMEALGLEVEEEEGRWLLVQPCRALAGTECRTYQHRPECCRTFECKLMRDVRSGAIRFDEATGVIRKFREAHRAGEFSAVQQLIDKRFLGRTT